MRSMGTMVTAILGGLLAAVVILPAPRAWGDTHNWDVSGTADWLTGANWAPAGPPIAGDEVRINLDGTAQIAGGTANAGLTIIDSWENGGLGGNLEVNAGGVLDLGNADLRVGAGYRDLTTGTLTVNGGTVQNVRWLEVPRQGKGILTINSGMVEYSAIWMSHYTLDGDDPSSLFGRIEMNGGQLVRAGNTDHFRVGSVGAGDTGGSAGNIVMTDGLIDDTVGGTYNRTLFLGAGAVGRFHQSGGTSKWSQIQISDDSTLTVTGTGALEFGSATTSGDDIIIFNGTLNLDGGTLTATDEHSQLMVGEDTGKTGTVNITGGHLDMTGGNNGDYYGSNSYGPDNGAGHGILNMSGGIYDAHRLRFGAGDGGTAVANLSGGTLTAVFRTGVGYGVGATGTMNISGTHVFEQIYDELVVGQGTDSIGTLNMSGGTVDNPTRGITFASGSGSRAYGTLTGGVMNVGGFTMGVGDNSRAEVSMGGTFALRSAEVVAVGYSGAGSYAQLSISNDAAVTIDGDSLNLGANPAGTGIVNMTGGTVTLTQTAANKGMLDIGRAGPGTLNLSGGSFECQEINYRRYTVGAGAAHINVSGDGILTARGVVRVQGVDPGSTLVATSGGVVDFGTTSSLTVNSDNSVTNTGGVFQFAKYNPTINPGAFGTVVVNGGTVSFRDIDNADVRCSQSGYPLSSNADISYQGENTFRLNAATNATSGQTYTFANTLGAANWATLELINGSLYRGGNVTIGSGGTLTVTGAASTIANDLTLQSGSTYSVMLDAGGTMSHVAVNGAVTLGGTLAIELASAPVEDQTYLVMDNNGTVAGAFASTKVSASYDGQTYNFSVRIDGNDVVAGWYTKGTVIRFE